MEITEAWATHPGDLPPYLLSRWLFLRLLGAVYFVAFVSLMVQVPGLVGEHGILPAGAFLQRAHALYGSAAYRLFPTVCWLGSDSCAGAAPSSRCCSSPASRRPRFSCSSGSAICR